MPGFGINRATGKSLGDWEHVVQSVEVIFTTRIGERVMRRHFGSSAPVLLGRAMTAANVLRFWSMLALALDLWEPRFRVVRVGIVEQSAEVTRQGHMSFFIEGEYRPRAHLSPPDFTPEGPIRRVLL